MDNDMTNNSARVRVYHPQGFQVYIEFAYSDPVSAFEEVNAIAAAGWLPSPADLPPGGEKEKIMSVVRRKKSDGTPIIDFYPEWNAAGTFGAHKYAHMYLDDNEMIAQFEAQSGLKLDDLPIYPAQQAMKRKYGATDKHEIMVKTPFDFVKIADGQHEGGMPKYKYQYAIERPVSVSAPTTGDSETATTGHWSDNPFNKKVIVDKMATLKLAWNTVAEHAEIGRTLSRVSDTTLTKEQFSERLDEIALLVMSDDNKSTGEGETGNNTNPLHNNTRKTA